MATCCNKTYRTFIYLPSGDNCMFMANIGESSSSVNWRKVNEGISVDKRTFTASAGNWYRIAKGKRCDNKDNTGAGGILTVMVDTFSWRSTTVISFSQNGGAGQIKVLTHSSFNGFFDKFRIIRGMDNFMYMDGYTTYATPEYDVTLTLNISGLGWNICDTIETANSDTGTVVQTESL